MQNLSKEYSAPSDGWLKNIDALEAGLCAIQLGAGRQKVTDKIDPAAGISFPIERGGIIHKGDPIFTIHTNRQNVVDDIYQRLQKAVFISPDEISPQPIILDYLDKNNLD